MRVPVLGAYGPIGAEIVRDFLHMGHDVLGFGRSADLGRRLGAGDRLDRGLPRADDTCRCLDRGAGGIAQPPAYHRLDRAWFACGFPAFVSVLAILWLMAARPMFGIL